ncbi:MAG: ATP-grasp domain-containing protein [Chitinivibrionales bacterium]|nr:ATP-grasp domain-containing protein [Chitinivibrionales bacterium]
MVRTDLDTLCGHCQRKVFIRYRYLRQFYWYQFPENARKMGYRATGENIHAESDGESRMKGKPTIKKRKVGVLIPDAEEWTAVKIARCLRHPDIKVYFLSRNRHSVAQHSNCKVKYMNLNYTCYSELLDGIKGLHTQHSFDVILPATLSGVEFIARYKKELEKIIKVPANPVAQQILLEKNKWDFIFSGNLLHAPLIPSVFIGNSAKNEIHNKNRVKKMRFPVLIKPVSGKGGWGIVKACGYDEVIRIWESKKGLIRHTGYFVQEYVPGNDYSMSVFCKKGEIIVSSIQESVLGNDTHYGPQRIMDFVHHDEIYGISRMLLKKLGWNGIACIDFRIDKKSGKCFVLEINCRLGQAVLGSLCAGINFPRILLHDALNIDLPKCEYKPCRYAHPAASVRALSGVLKPHTQKIKIGWHESGLQYTLMDPMPEIIELFNHLSKTMLLAKK